jgi:hypothetical protein
MYTTLSLFKLKKHTRINFQRAHTERISALGIIIPLAGILMMIFSRAQQPLPPPPEREKRTKIQRAYLQFIFLPLHYQRQKTFARSHTLGSATPDAFCAREQRARFLMLLCFSTACAYILFTSSRLKNNYAPTVCARAARLDFALL